MELDNDIIIDAISSAVEFETQHSRSVTIQTISCCLVMAKAFDLLNEKGCDILEDIILEANDRVVGKKPIKKGTVASQVVKQ